MDTQKESSASSAIDWKEFGSFVFRFVTGIGLILFWIVLCAATVLLLGWGVKSVVVIPGSWMFGILLMVPVVGCIWWISFFVSIDILSSIGVEVHGSWRWVILPVALLLAPVMFLALYVAGFGRMVHRRPIVAFFFLTGIFVITVIAIEVISIQIKGDTVP